MSRLISRTAVVVAVAAAGFAATAATAAPALDSLRLPKEVSAQQGHARFLAGIRLSEPAKLTVQVLTGPDGAVMQTITDSQTRPAGRAYLRVEAVDSMGYQLPAGNYRLRIQPMAASGEAGTAVEGRFRLKLTPARGLFDLFAVPLMRPLRSSAKAGARVAGQYVAVVGPRGAAATAGLRRGDIITAVGGTTVDTPGAYATALRALRAGTAVKVDYLRAGQSASVEVTPKPDWEPAPNYAASLTVATRREPRSLVLAYARVRERVAAKEYPAARTLLAAWPRNWRRSAAGQFLEADLLAGEEKWRAALGAYNRARKADATHAHTELGRAIATIELGRPRQAVGMLAAAERLDPKDAEVAGYQAYAFLRAELGPRAIAAGQRAVSLDRFYADAYLPLGIALLGAEQRAPGVQALRRGLILLDDDQRANRLITTYLNPTDP